MPFTDLSDLYGAVNEEGINRVVRHVMRKRPSLFNYGTQAVIASPSLRCARIDAAPEVLAYGNPVMTREDPLPILGTDGRFGLDFCVQLTDVKVDFHPGGAVTLPPELAPLDAQRFAVSATACAGIGCPSEDWLRRLREVLTREKLDALRAATHMSASAKTHGFSSFQPVDRPKEPGREPDREPKPPPLPIPVDRLNCFCLSLFLEGHFETGGTPGMPELEAHVDGVEIVDLAPRELEDSIECYLRLVLEIGVLPQLTVAIQKLVLDVVGMMPAGTGVEIPFGTPQIPFNPAVEQDELRVRINVTTGP
jgi:hypothetical protein